MEVIKLSIRDIDRHKLDIVDMLRQSHEISFPDDMCDYDYHVNRVKKLKTYIKNDKAIALAIRQNTKLVALVWFFEKTILGKNVLHVNHFVVDEIYRGIGLGRLLIEEVHKHGESKNISQVELLATKNNIEAVRFYEKNGYDIERFLMVKRLL